MIVGRRSSSGGGYVSHIPLPLPEHVVIFGTDIAATETSNLGVSSEYAVEISSFHPCPIDLAHKAW